MTFVFFSFLLHAIVPKFPQIFVHDSYTVILRYINRRFEKCYIVAGQPVIIT